MGVVLNKETVQICDVVCQKYSQTNVEVDVIVPDTKPDIAKVLEVSGFISTSEKTIHSGKVYVKGCVNMTLLYAPDGEVMSAVKSLSVSQEFNHSIDGIPTDDNLLLSAEIEPENFNYSLINSRKVSLRCSAGISIKLTRSEDLDISTEIQDSTDIYTDTKPIKICNCIVNSENRISLCTKLDLPSGKPSISELLKTTVFPQSTDFSFTEGIAILSGQVKICTLYTSINDGSIQVTENTIPFNEVIDVPSAQEDMEGEIEYSLSDLYCEIRDDSDGEPRIIGVDIGLCASVKGFEIKEIPMLCDAYSIKDDCEIVTEEKTIEQLIDNSTAQFTHKISLSKPDILPEIAQICDVSSSASVDRIVANNGEITVFGKVHSNILYIGNDQSLPLGAFSDSSEFTHTFTVPSATENTVCDAKIYPEHLSYTLSGIDGIDLRVVLGLSLRSYKHTTILPLTDIIVKDSENQTMPCITIYFVKDGDTLWKIAKKYKTTVDCLKECNGLTSDNINVGQVLKICR